MRRRLLRVAGFASGAIAATFAYRRWLGPGRERVEIYFDDGSFVTFAAGSREAARLLPLAHQVFVAAQRV